MSTAVLDKRRRQVATVTDGKAAIDCAKPSLAGSVSQRACVFCGSRVVLYPIVDAVHLVHGPAGCAAYTWDIRGTVSSGPELHRLSFTTDLREKDVIFGGAEKLERALRELIARYNPQAAFVYATCIVGVIGDDVDSVCRKVSAEAGIPIVPVRSEGFRGTKKDGYAAACDALAELIGTREPAEPVPPYSINILGDFNLAGELWILEDYYRRMGVNIQARITGDGRVDDICKAHHAKLNVVQCSGSMTYLARHMKEKYGVPFKQVSYFGIEDMSAALYEVAAFFGAPALHEKAAELVRDEVTRLLPMLEFYRGRLSGRKAVIYVGGAFKTISLIKALRLIGVETVVCGSQTGRPEDYDTMAGLCAPGTIIVDDSNPVELSTFARERGADLFIGGVKERPIAFKMGMAFCDHNHERKLPLAGYEGMKNFAEEVYGSVMTPVWRHARGQTSDVGDRKSEIGEPRTENGTGDVEPVSVPHSSVERRESRVDGVRPPTSDFRPPASDAVTVNPCKVCSPLGACVAFRGVAGCIPLIHGSQGCATYIRRYTISHFREPMDIASSSISEDSTVFGGTVHFSTALDNIIRQYSPAAIGICTSCLSETIGDDVALFLREYRAAHKGQPLPALIRASTPSYKGTHMDGFHAAVRAILEGIVKEKAAPAANQLLLLPGFVSPADLRHLKDVVADFGLDPILVPDYSETLDGPSWDEYHRLPEGGTPVERIAASANSAAALQFGRGLQNGGGDWLDSTFGVPCQKLGLPIGVRESDAFFGALTLISGKPLPRRFAQERGRLLDSYVDGHKYLFGKRAVVYGEEDLVVGIASLLNEIGVNPVLCATGGTREGFRENVLAVTADAQRLFPGELEIMADTDHDTIFARAESLKPDIVIGNSKGYKMARKLGVPLVRVGFPIHDRIGGQRLLHVGYRGTQNLFDLICNALMEAKQEQSPIAFMYV